jgi:hypothetical protein
MKSGTTFPSHFSDLKRSAGHAGLRVTFHARAGEYFFGREDSEKILIPYVTKGGIKSGMSGSKRQPSVVVEDSYAGHARGKFGTMSGSSAPRSPSGLAARVVNQGP